MEEIGCDVVCGAPTTSAVKGWVKMEGQQAINSQNSNQVRATGLALHCRRLFVSIFPSPHLPQGKRVTALARLDSCHKLAQLSFGFAASNWILASCQLHKFISGPQDCLLI